MIVMVHNELKLSLYCVSMNGPTSPVSPFKHFKITICVLNEKFQFQGHPGLSSKNDNFCLASITGSILAPFFPLNMEYVTITTLRRFITRVTLALIQINYIETQSKFLLIPSVIWRDISTLMNIFIIRDLVGTIQINIIEAQPNFIFSLI